MTQNHDPSEPRQFKLTDDCTLSGLRLNPEDQRIQGGGYLDPNHPDQLIPAHGLVEVLAEEEVGRRLKSGERVTPPPYG